MRCGLLGEKLGHSFSKEIHEKLGYCEYELFEVPPEGLDAFLTARDFDGINVTIPYKQSVIPYLEGMSPRAEAIGAVNTVVNRGGRLWGDNTDFGGLEALIRRRHEPDGARRGGGAGRGAVRADVPQRARRRADL